VARQVLAYSRDAFSYDGCATSLQACLKEPGHQRHALRMLDLATTQAAAGNNNTKIDTLLNRYYVSFAAGERQAFDLGQAACRGPEAAPVTLVEFSDFECPHCRAAAPILESVVSDAGPVRVCYLPFPLRAHTHAADAARLALWAKGQGHFWELHDLLFAHQESLDTDSMVRYAEAAGLDAVAAAVTLRSTAFASEVAAARAQGERAKITGTPALFVNGRPLVLPLNRENLRHAIDDELEWVNHGGRWASE
jgi:protein-disulfide isomerase